MRKIGFWILVLGLMVGFSHQNAFSQENGAGDEKSQQKKCSPLTESLEFCIEAIDLSFAQGEPVVLPYSIKNATSQEIEVGGRAWAHLLHFAVFDENGKKLPTFHETIFEKMSRNEPLSEEEAKRLITRGSYRGAYFAPEQERKITWPADYFYDLTKPGRYEIEISKNAAVENENPNKLVLLEKIKFEVK